MTFSEMTSDAIIMEVGRRFKLERLNRNLSQQDVWEDSGCSKKVVQNLEAGKGCTLVNFVKILRTLSHIDELQALLPEDKISPIQLAALQGRKRQRASGKKS